MSFKTQRIVTAINQVPENGSRAAAAAAAAAAAILFMETECPCQGQELEFQIGSLQFLTQFQVFPILSQIQVLQILHPS